MSAVDQAAPELLPCQFCGGAAKSYISRDEDHSRYGIVSCLDCAASARSASLHWMDNTDAELEAQHSAEMAWNRRSDLAALSAPAEVEGLVERLRGPVARAARDLIAAYFKTGERKCLASIPARPDHDADLLLTAGIADAATALTALQAENERLRARLRQECEDGLTTLERADKAGDVADQLAKCFRTHPSCDGYLILTVDVDRALAAHAKLKGEV